MVMTAPHREVIASREGSELSGAKRESERLGQYANSSSRRGGNGAPESWKEERDELNRDRTLNHWMFSGIDDEGKLDLTKRSRLANCGKVKAKAGQGGTRDGMVEARRGSETGVASFSGYQTCGSIAACPICGPKIRNERAKEIAEALEIWLKRDGHSVFMATLTTPHTLGQELGDLFGLISKGWNSICSGRARKDIDEFGMFGFIKALDITRGDEFGWHPHFHALFFFKPTEGLSPEDQQKRLMGHLRKKWSGFINENQPNGKVNEQHGIRVDRISDNRGIAKYVTKVAPASMELARTDKKQASKSGMTPQMIMRDARYGDVDSMGRWREYVEATKGRRFIEWSRAGKDRVSLREDIFGYTDEDVLSDEEIAAQGTDDEVVAVLGNHLASLIGRNVEVRIKAMRGIEANGFDGLRYALETDLGLNLLIEWCERPYPEDPESGERPEPQRIQRFELAGKATAWQAILKTEKKRKQKQTADAVLRLFDIDL